MLLIPVVTVTPVMVSPALPEFVTVTTCGVLVVPTNWLAKVKVLVESVTLGVSTAVPLSPMLCGESGALSLMTTAPSRVPDAKGLNVTAMAQLAPAASVAGQVLLEIANSDAFTPVMVGAPAKVKLALPVFVSTTVWGLLVVFTGWLANARLAGDRLTAGAWPVPLRLTVCGLPVALSETVTVPVRAPLAVGVKVTAIVQVPLGATWADVEHVVVAAKA